MVQDCDSVACQMVIILMTLKITSGIYYLSGFRNLENLAHMSYDRNQKVCLAYNLDCRVIACQPVTYAVKVVVSQKWCIILTLLLQITNRK